MSEIIVSPGDDSQVVVGHAVPGSFPLILPQDLGLPVGVSAFEVLPAAPSFIEHAFHSLTLDRVRYLVWQVARFGPGPRREGERMQPREGQSAAKLETLVKVQSAVNNLCFLIFD